MNFRSILTAQWRSLWRHGLPQIYGLLLVVFAVVIRLLPAGLRPLLATLFALTDTMLLGYFLMGALVLLEKKQGTELALFLLPGGTSRVLLARTVIFSLFALVAMIGLSVVAGTPLARIALSLPPLVLGAALFTTLGCALALRTRTMNAFMLLAGVSMVPCIAGLLLFAGLRHPLLGLSPSWGVAFSVGSRTWTEWLVGMMHIIAWYVIALLFLAYVQRQSARMEA